MKRELHAWHSPALNKTMEIAIYGHFGMPLLLVPTAAADYLEYERFLMIDVIKPFIDSGKVKVFPSTVLIPRAGSTIRCTPDTNQSGTCSLIITSTTKLFHSLRVRHLKSQRSLYPVHLWALFIVPIFILSDLT